MAQDSGLNRIYLDVSALGRLFDDPQQLRIRVEADSVRLILTAVERHVLTLIDSVPLRMEINANPNRVQRRFLTAMLDRVAASYPVGIQELQRQTAHLQSVGVSEMDALHAITAQLLDAAFVTCDDRLTRALCRTQTENWFCGSPVDYCRKAGLI